MNLLAQMTIAMQAFELSNEGREKIGMHSVTIGSFFEELEKIAAGMGSMASAMAKSVSKIHPESFVNTIPISKLRAKAVLQGAGGAVGGAAKTNAGRVGARAAAPVPKSGTSFKAPSGEMTGTHMRSNAPGGTQVGTQVSPRAPGQGSTQVGAPRVSTQGTASSIPNPAPPPRPASAPPPAAGKKKGLLGTLALGGLQKQQASTMAPYMM